eukprot:TRINITY_DN12094_c0_g1_i1.p1 TRINITY_DN12094_c0_g1~~TRINITY_DN12094_c0_g1_i1.p1  ORF type:complete len:518 (+),score=95.10 TRINITY_DN12094_c0_g1_i1:134-1687(+)
MTSSYALPADLDLDCKASPSGVSLEKAQALSTEECESYMFGAATRDEQPTVGVMLKAYPHFAPSLLRLLGSVMGSGGPFLMSEKFLMAAYAAKLNGSFYCCSVYKSAANALGVPNDVLESVVYDIEMSNIDPPLKPCFRFIRELVLRPWGDQQSHRQAILNAGWSKRGLFDIITIAGLFSMMGRIVNGCGLLDSVEMYHKVGQMIAEEGYTSMSTAFNIGVEAELRASYAEDSVQARPGVASVASPELLREAFDLEMHLIPGQVVQLEGLRKHKYNGYLGKILEFVPAAGNWRVELQCGVVLRVNEKNCRPVPEERKSEFSSPPAGHGEPWFGVGTSILGGAAVFQPYPEVGLWHGKFLASSSSHTSAEGNQPQKTGDSLAWLPSKSTTHQPADANAAQSGTSSQGNEPLDLKALHERLETRIAEVQRNLTKEDNEMEALQLRFRLVHDKLLAACIPDPCLEDARIVRDAENVSVTFRVSQKWCAMRKAMFAKLYSKLFKERRRKMSVQIEDTDSKA